jgi:hypothetical protein
MKDLFKASFYNSNVIICSECANEIQKFIDSIDDCLVETINFEVLKKASLTTNLERMGKNKVRSQFSQQIKKLSYVRDAWLNFNPQETDIFNYMHEFNTREELHDLLQMKTESVIYLNANINFYTMYLELAFPQGNVMTDFYFREFMCDIHDVFERLINRNSTKFKLNNELFTRLHIIENDHKDNYATPARLTALLYHAFNNPKSEKTVKNWYKSISKTRSEYRRLQNFNLSLFLDSEVFPQRVSKNETEKRYFDSLTDTQLELANDRINLLMKKRKKDRDAKRKDAI